MFNGLQKIIRIAWPANKCTAVENLRRFRPSDLAGLLDDPTISAEWPAVASVVNAIIDIPDGATGGVNPGDRRALYFLTRGLEPHCILEIGTHVGASTMHLAAALLRLGPVKRLITVDIADINEAEDAYWRTARLRRSPRDCIEALGASSFVEFAQASGSEFLKRTENRFDFIFLDGDHSERAVYREIPLALAKLRRGGCVVLHDYFPGGQPLWKGSEPVAGPFLAVERLRREGAQMSVLPFGELPWPTKGGSRISSLALLVGTP